MTMQLPKVTLKARGSVRPPDDLLMAAHLTLKARFDEFLSRYGAAFTAADLCSFVEEINDGSRP